MLIMTVLLLVGCEYISPLDEEHTIPIDPAVLGLWQPVLVEGRKFDRAEQLMIMKFSDTEYVIFVSGIFFRGYPINVGGIHCVQLQVLADWNGPVKRAEKNLFQVATYHLEKDELTVKRLNGSLVDNMLKRDELRKEFLKYKDSKDLFIEPVKFKKVEQDFRR
ncbi:MAG: hypothetical protein ACYC7L_13930 [Nitrospirota bacterium]